LTEVALRYVVKDVLNIVLFGSNWIISNELLFAKQFESKKLSQSR